MIDFKWIGKTRFPYLFPVDFRMGAPQNRIRKDWKSQTANRACEQSLVNYFSRFWPILVCMTKRSFIFKKQHSFTKRRVWIVPVNRALVIILAYFNCITKRSVVLQNTVFPYYKASRKKEREESQFDWSTIFNSLSINFSSLCVS